MSSTGDNHRYENAKRGGRVSTPTHENWIINVFRFDNIAQEHRRFLLALDAVVVIKYDTRRVDDPQAALELDRLQLHRVSRLRGNGTHLHHNEARVIKNGKNCYLARRRTLAHLSVLIRLLLPTLGKPTTPTVTLCDALGLYALRSLGGEQCRGRARRQVRTLMRTRRAEWERRGCVAEVFEPCLGILARYPV
jgi:hypothetical protein